MGKVNWARVILGGLIAGVVINVCEWVANGVVMEKNWASAMQALGKPTQFTSGQLVVFNIWGFVMGIAAVWLYAAIRPRYGAGPRTAACAGLAAWFFGNLLPTVGSLVMGLFPLPLIIGGTIVGLIEIVAGTELGAWLYKEEGVAATASAAAGS